MAATTFELEIDAGGTTEFVVDVVGGPIALDGYTGRMQIRSIAGDDVVLTEVSPGDITVNPLTRQVTVKIPGDETSGYGFRRGVYELLIVHASNVPWSLAKGHVLVYSAITEA